MHFSTLPDDRAAAEPDAPAIADDTTTLTNAQLAERVRAAAGALVDHGVVGGDVVAVQLANRVELLLVLFAAWRIGVTVNPLNPVLTGAEATHQVLDARSVLLVTADGTGPVEGVTTIGVAALDSTTPTTPAVPASDDLALLIYTSGTTGQPKGVMLTHANLDAMTESFIEWLDITSDDHSMLVLPLFHANGIVLGTLTPLRAGGRVSITGRFSRDRFFADVERLRPTYFSAVPAIYAMLSALPDDVHPDTSSLRMAVCGAAPMPAQLIRRFEERFGLTLVEGYGLSETTCASTINPLHGTRKPGTVGLPLPGQRVDVVDPEGRHLPAGEVGEVVIAGPTVMAGYLHKPEETARSIVDGWLRTGDVGRFDEDGYLVLVDRVKDMIIRGGENIYPKEIESVLYRHPDVLEAAVVGRPDDVLGEVPTAFVSLRPGATADAEALLDLCRGVLSAYKLPVHIELVGELPKNPVGKIDKPALRRDLSPTPMS
ncbi:class I adenylate-forming enzyme family protein [Aeromicrobium fastidiosum]|uniref:Long-chain fatty acid--CoA ligase n=1 Tax=Aeromicrobium fastidiosum TaxID=52699 RepID=A0A641ARP8_9ACTN|nr:AMP-binding protein [Aeromicrobium fastidiosum]KAA1380619.1 long-chain fatty acid--CoA ligase [Aeromicrobium fastidiosum]MBP2390221.1 acyl-CoA synthetase (AMP-forming)/AMP-acid ligase II [Aeromicrobium fastidiosum]